MGVIDQTRVPAPSSSIKLPSVVPSISCKLKKLKLERVHDWLLLEKQFVSNQETTKEYKNDDNHNNNNDKNDDTEEKKYESLNDNDKIEVLSGSPLVIGTLDEKIDDDHCIVTPSDSGLSYYVRILSFVDKRLLKLNCKLLLHAKHHHVVGSLPNNSNPTINAMKVEYAPNITYADIGGLDSQIEEIKEAVELPLVQPELFEEIGIEPPHGAIFYGKPGTGKSLLAQAVANATKATFLRLCASELISSHSGSGPKLVKELFDVAKQLQPTIIFIDEVDAIGAKRYNAQSSGEKEIHRTMIELLTQLQGFDKRQQIKVIMATNCIQNLDPALIRAGRIDRKIEFPVPNLKTKIKIFHIHTKKMNLENNFRFEQFVNDNDELVGADIKAICTEAGLLALRQKRMMVTMKDFIKAKEMVNYRKKDDIPEGMYI